jgi:hypothetical protein
VVGINLNRQNSKTGVMFAPKKIFAAAIIVTFLATVTLALFENKSDLVKLVYEIRDDNYYGEPSGDLAGYTIKAKGLYNTPVDLYYSPSDKDANFSEVILDCVTEFNSKAPKALFSGNIIEDNSTTIETVPQDVDHKNELVFADLGETGTISVAYVWVTKGSRLVVDFDIVLNTHYDWGNPGSTSNTTYPVEYIDTWSVVTHELGHGVGLGDLDQNPLYWQTMYGYAGYGETWKRTLEYGDVAGLNAIYG